MSTNEPRRPKTFHIPWTEATFLKNTAGLALKLANYAEAERLYALALEKQVAELKAEQRVLEVEAFGINRMTNTTWY